MAIPVARVHLKVAHAALPALLPTPPKWKMLPPPRVAAAVLPKPLAKPSRADYDERWDAHKQNKTAAISASSRPRSTSAADSAMSCAGRGRPSHKSATSPPKPGRADSAERWDAHKKQAATILASSSSSSSSSGMSSLVSSKCSISGASSAERSDVHKKRCPPQTTELLDDGDSSSTGSNDDIDDTEEDEIVWKPRAMYAGPGFVAAAPEPAGVLPMPTSFLVPVA